MRIELTEHGTVVDSAAACAAAAGMNFAELQSHFAKLVDFVLQDGGSCLIQSGACIGTLALGDLTIHVKPRLAARELATMIRYALGAADPRQRAAIESSAAGLNELLALILADEAAAIQRIGISRHYIRRRERLTVLRGRPDFTASFPWNDGGMTSINCRYHELTYDNLDNQLLRRGLAHATTLPISVEARRQLLEHRQAWSSLASDIHPNRHDFIKARERYSRLSEHYRLAHHIVERLLFREAPGSFHDDAPTATSGLVMNMAWLFERFVERWLGQVMAHDGVTVQAQAVDRGAILDGEGNLYCEVRPDLVLFRECVPIAVVDAKYKTYWPADALGRPRRRIDNSDLYQLFFYGRRLQQRYGLAEPPAIAIVSPLPAGDERGGDSILPPQYRTITWRAGGEQCVLNLILLPLTDMLRAMACGQPLSSSGGMITIP
ncbi:MAG TPA: hypothetical protein VF175_00850 [Lacipirellula sp.]